MQLPEPIVSLKQYHEAIEAALTLSDVPVYLDTSVLMWCLKLGKEPREELLQWFQSSLKNRIHIPIWTAHELYRHLREETVTIEVRNRFKQYQKSMGELFADVCVTADELLSADGKYPARSDIIRDTRENALRLHETLSSLLNTKKLHY